VAGANQPTGLGRFLHECPVRQPRNLPPTPAPVRVPDQAALLPACARWLQGAGGLLESNVFRPPFLARRTSSQPWRKVSPARREHPAAVPGPKSWEPSLLHTSRPGSLARSRLKPALAQGRSRAAYVPSFLSSQPLLAERTKSASLPCFCFSSRASRDLDFASGSFFTIAL
jgi:hypothetical protein